MDRIQEAIREIGPHLLVLILAIAALVGLLTVLVPVQAPIVDGIALAVLTHALVFVPIDRALRRMPVPWRPDRRRAVAAGLATVVLVGGIAALILMVLGAALGGFDVTLAMVWGVATGDLIRTQTAIDQLTVRAATLWELYPTLPGSAADLRPLFAELLGAGRPGVDLMRWVVGGTGGMIAEVALASATLFYLYQRGGRLAHRLLAALPLDIHASNEVRRRLRVTTGVIVAGALAKAVALGVSAGLLAWVIGGFDPILVAVVGVLTGLLPLLGPMTVWLPLASLLASQGYWLEAGCLAVATQSAAWLINVGLDRWHQAYAADRLWLNFILFLAVVGGLASGGLRGLILGPAAVVAAAMALDLLGSLYGARSVRRAKEPAPGAPTTG